jgi:integrase
MGNIGISSNGTLCFNFVYNDVHCQEQTAIPNTPENRKMMRETLKRIEGEIALGIFDYGRYFPKSINGALLASGRKPINTATFEQYAESWFRNNKISWKPSTQRNIRSTLKRYLIPYFGNKLVTEITKPMIKEFRTSLAPLNGRKGNKISHKTINYKLGIFRMVMNEAVEEYGISSRFLNVKPLKVVKPDIIPFSLEEVIIFLKHVPSKYYDYYIARFFTGMRTAEIDGLQWKFVDFTLKKILVRETWETRQWISPKTETSVRDIDMSPIVEEALLRQKERTGRGNIVFPTRSGKPLDRVDITRRIWYPTLKKAGLARRTPYQSRHTAATMWLASGENPEWVARQLGHSTTKLLFKTYSKYIRNLTRKDGSAFETFLEDKLKHQKKR